MLKKLKSRIKSLNFNPKNELIKFIILVIGILALTALAYFTLNKFYVLILGILIEFCGVFAFIYRYKLYEEDKRRRLEQEFVEVFSYIRIYLVNKENVYVAIQKASKYSSKEMNDQITNLLKKIDEDKSIVPFLDFAGYFKNKIIEEVMISMYQMIDGGYTEMYLNQFISIFEQFRNRLNNENMQKRYKKLNFYNTLSIVGSGYLMFVMLLAIVHILGELTNGI